MSEIRVRSKNQNRVMKIRYPSIRIRVLSICLHPCCTVGTYHDITLASISSASVLLPPDVRLKVVFVDMHKHRFPILVSITSNGQIEKNVARS